MTAQPTPTSGGKVAQDLINAWGRAKYPDAPKGDFTLEVGHTQGGCPTCDYGTETYVEVSVGHKTIDQIADADFAQLLGEMLAAGGVA